jgi:hypothetical protein
MGFSGLLMIDIARANDTFGAIRQAQTQRTVIGLEPGEAAFDGFALAIVDAQRGAGRMD